jgi:hypothetical protein
MHHGFDDPDSPLAVVVDRGMQIIGALVESHGGEVENIFIAVSVTGMEPDACVAGYGYKDPVDLITELMSHATQVAKRIGKPIAIFPMPTSDN